MCSLEVTVWNLIVLNRLLFELPSPTLVYVLVHIPSPIPPSNLHFSVYTIWTIFVHICCIDTYSLFCTLCCWVFITYLNTLQNNLRNSIDIYLIKARIVVLQAIIRCVYVTVCHHCQSVVVIQSSEFWGWWADTLHPLEVLLCSAKIE